MTDSDIGMVPVREHIAGGEPLPDLIPRESKVGLYAGLIVGGVFLAVDLALLTLAIVGLLPV